MNPSPPIRPRRAVLAALTILAAVAAGTAFAHDAPHQSSTATGSATPSAPATAAAPNDAALPGIGGPFTLMDQNGRTRSDRDFRGRFMLIFFGYANCRSICPIGLRHMAEALKILGPAGARIQPVLITVDPDADTPAVLREYAPRIHPRLLALTGTREQLRDAAAAYRVESRIVAHAPDGTPIFAHGSFLYLIGPDGRLASLFPPVIGAEKLAEILRRYIS